MIELNRLAMSARNLCEEILRCASDRGSTSAASSMSMQSSPSAAEELGARLLHQALAADSRHRPSEFTPKRDVVALAEQHGALARGMSSGGVEGAGKHCDAEVDQCKAAAGALQAMLHNDFQQPELLPPEVLACSAPLSMCIRRLTSMRLPSGLENVRDPCRRNRRSIFRSGSCV